MKNVIWGACAWAVFLCLGAGALLAQENRAIGVVKIRPPDAPGGQEIQLYKGSHALVIGVSDYEDLQGKGWPDLPGVRKDVEAVKAALEKHEFNVTVAMDPNSEALRKAFQDFIDKRGLDPQNRLLFYFAGHGHTLKKSWGGDMGYIVPADAPNPNRDRDGFLTKALDMQQIEVYAKRIESKHALFLFDCCFSGSLFDMTRAVPDVISWKTTKPVRQFVTAGQADETVPDRSIFREQFVDGIAGQADVDKDGYVTCTELGEFPQKTVLNYSKQTQHPQYGKIRDKNLDQGDFVFQVPLPGTTPPGPWKPAVTPDAAARPAATATPAPVAGESDPLVEEEYSRIIQEAKEILDRYEESLKK